MRIFGVVFCGGVQRWDRRLRPPISPGCPCLAAAGLVIDVCPPAGLISLTAPAACWVPCGLSIRCLHPAAWQVAPTEMH